MGNSKSLSQSRRPFSGGVSLPDLQHIAGCQLGATLSFATSYALRIEMCRVTFADCSALASLRDFVSHICGVVAKKQMVGVDAFGNVAAMKDVASGRDWPVDETPHHAVSSLRSSVNKEDSVAFTGSSRPQPTRSKFWKEIWDGSVFVDFIPEPFRWIFRSGFTGASRRADPPGVVSPGRMKRAPALFARSVWSARMSHTAMIPELIGIGITI